jgi:hypothetical protein
MKGSQENMVKMWEDLHLLFEKKGKRPKSKKVDTTKNSTHDRGLVESQVDLHTSSHVEDVCIEEDQTTTYEIINETDDTSVLDGENKDKKSCPTFDDHEEIFQSVDVEDPTSSTVYDAYDEGSSSIITPMHDEDPGHDYNLTWW